MCKLMLAGTTLLAFAVPIAAAAPITYGLGAQAAGSSGNDNAPSTGGGGDAGGTNGGGGSFLAVGATNTVPLAGVCSGNGSVVINAPNLPTTVPAPASLALFGLRCRA